ncbi:MAG TPA: DUF11 domain-containing protein, partial [Anseongella sp.]|nr:DUF11 domain-containing protein [Anseongella sp.]
NKGPSRILAGDVLTLLDNLPAGYAVRNYAASEGEFNYLTGEWTEIDFTVGKTITLTIYGVVSSTFEGSELSNTATVAPPPGVSDPVMPNAAQVIIPASREANLELTKNGPAEMAPNEEIWYSIRVENRGPSYARGVSISDQVPPEILVDQWQASPGPGARILSGESGSSNDVAVSADIPAGSEVIIRIRGMVTTESAGRIENTAEAVLPDGISDPTIPNTDTHGNTLAGLDDLLVRKTGPGSASSGGSLSYTVQLINNTGSMMTGIRFDDNVTSGDVLSGIRWTVTPNDPRTVIRPMGNINSLPVSFEADIPPGKKVTVVLSARISPDFEGELLNRATAEAGDFSAADEVSTVVRKPPALEVVKTGPAQAEAGSEITYTITASNKGSGAAGEIVIADHLPLGSRYVTAEGGTYNEHLHRVTWPAISSIAPGASETRSVTLRAPANGPEITNIATATGQAASFTTAILPRAGLAVSKVAPDSVYQEAEFIYTLRAVNKGPSTATNITLTDILPGGLEVLDPGGGAVNGQEITWTVPSMPRNGVRTFDIRVRAPAESLSLTNTANISSGTPDPDNSDNSSSAVTQVLPSADLLIQKTGPAEAYAGGEIEYQLSVSNLGPSPAQNIEVSDRFPAGMQFISSDIPPADSLAVPLRWILPQLGAGETRSIAVRVRAPGRVGPVRNTADVKSPFHDKDLVNNRAVFSTNITPAADMQVIKGGTAAVDSAGVITYEILVRNIGPSTALTVNIRDQLPRNLGEPLSISHGGTYDAASHSISWPALPAMAAGTERLLTVRLETAAAGDVFTATNTAMIVSEVFDPETANNRSEFETSVYPPAEVYFELSPSRVCKGAP